MTGSLLSVALSGIQAAQAGLNTTSHNIANANTPGYSRQKVVQSAQNSVLFGPGYVGSGVKLDAISRSYNDLLAGQVRSAESQSARSSVYAQNTAQLNALLGDENGSVATALSGFFASVQGVTAKPGDVALRQSVYASAQSVVQRFQGMQNSLTQQREQINQRAEVLVSDLNGRTQAIADISGRIVNATGAGRAPNDLLDQRDAMLGELNKLVRITVTNEADGAINVYLNNGQPLINHSIVQKLALTDNPHRQDSPVLGVRAGNTVMSLAGNGDVGGEIGGLLASRDEALYSVEASMGRLARVFSESLNERNHLGIDLAGNAGGDVFAMDPPEAVPATGNAGTAAVAATITDAGALKASDYRLQVTASGYTVTRLSDDQQQTFAAAPITIDGLQLDVTGGAAVGDSYNIRSVSGAVASMRLALPDANAIATASPLRIDPASTNTGTATTAVAVDADDPALHDPAQLTFDGSGNVTVTTSAGATVMPYTQGTPISMNGWSVTVRGSPSAGDTFQIGANTVVDGDNRNAAAMAALETENIMPGMAFSGAYAALVVDIGTRGRDAQATSAANDGLAASLLNDRESFSGVNLDEEAINLMRYQQAYQAAGRMIGVANAIFESILSITR
jgi:flagellar hook-associated protein 1 FlgK